MLRTLLCIPPDYDHNFPPLGTPALTAFLKKNGFACSQIDLNLAYRDFLAGSLSGPKQLSRDERLFFLEPALKQFFKHRLQGRYYSAFLPKKGDGLFPNIPYGNYTNSSFYFCERLLSSQHLWRYLEDGVENTFYRFYEKNGIINRLKNEGVGLFGISVISPSQVIASLTLGLMVKKRLPRVHVNIGGQWPTLYRQAILGQKELFRAFDSVTVFEGEKTLCALAQQLEAGVRIPSIPNLLMKDAGSDSGPACSEPVMDELPCPDFEGLALGDYDASKDGQLSLTYESSRGCYWSKCAYCVDLPLPRPSYRCKDPALVVRDMKELKDRYNAGYVLFSDPGLSPRQMRQVSRQLLDTHVRIEWWTMARLDPGFDRPLFDLAYAAGLRQVNFGFETASDRISALLEKGNQRQRSSRIIKDCAQAGIKVDLQTMLGLPGETFADGMETIDFLAAHKEHISSVTFNTYYLTPFNCVHGDPQRYGIEYERQESLPFAFFIPFRNQNGMAMDWAYQLEKIYHSLVRQEPGGPVAGAPAAETRKGFVDLSLNNESSRLAYRCDPRTENYTFLYNETA